METDWFSRKIHNNHLLEYFIVEGEFANWKVLIPRITFKAKERESPFWMDQKTISSGSCFCNDNKQISGSDP